jgi:hypothetical protein
MCPADGASRSASNVSPGALPGSFSTACPNSGRNRAAWWPGTLNLHPLGLRPAHFQRSQVGSGRVSAAGNTKNGQHDRSQIPSCTDRSPNPRSKALYVSRRRALPIGLRDTKAPANSTANYSRFFRHSLRACGIQRSSGTEPKLAVILACHTRQ